jgi:hypothetical protein
MRPSFGLLIVAVAVAVAGCSSSGKIAVAPTPTTIPATIPTTTTLDPAAVDAFISRFEADTTALGGTTHAVETENGTALDSDCALGRTQVATVRVDLDDPLLRGGKHQGSLRGIVLSGLDELDAGFVICATDTAAMVGHLNAGIRLLNQVVAAFNNTLNKS